MANVHYLWLCLVLGLHVGIISGQKGIKALSRHKRSVLQLGHMLECSTNRSMWDYNGYGCWCGLGGAGKPLDETDKCCQTHDNCYNKMHKEKACKAWIEEYTAIYQYTGCSLCSPLSAYKSWVYKFLLASPKCRYRMCQCDSGLAACTKKASGTFNPAYRHYQKKTCKQLRRWTDVLTKPLGSHAKMRPDDDFSWRSREATTRTNHGAKTMQQHGRLRRHLDG